MRPLDLLKGSRLAAVLVLLLSAMAACTVVKADDVVGTWSMSERSRDYLPVDLRSLSPRLSLGPAGTFVATDFPESQIRQSAPVNVALTGRGTWKVMLQGGRSVIDLRFESDFGTQLYVADSLGSELTLYYFLTDPDSGQRIEFTRER